MHGVQQAAEIAFFKLKNARSYRFHNLPTTRILDLKKGQIIRVVDRRDIAFFRAKNDVVVECDKHGSAPDDPIPGVISTPKAKTLRRWKGTPVPSLAQPQVTHGQPAAAPGTRVIGSPLPPAQNPTGVQAASVYAQNAPGIQISRIAQATAPVPQPVLAPSPNAPRVITAPGGLAAASRYIPPAAGRRPQGHYGQRPEVVAGPQPQVHPGAAAPQLQLPVEQQLAVTTPQLPQTAADQPAATAPLVPNGDVPGTMVVETAPQDSVQPAQTPVATVDVPEHLLAQPIPPGGLPQRPEVVGQTAAPQVLHTGPPTVVGGPTQSIAGGSASVVPGTRPISAPGGAPGVSASLESQAMFAGAHGVPEPSHEAQQILHEHGLAAPPTKETPIESVGQDGNLKGEF